MLVRGSRSQAPSSATDPLLVEVRVGLAPFAQPELAAQLGVGGVVVGVRQVQRQAQDRALDHRARLDVRLESVAAEAVSRAASAMNGAGGC